MHQFPSTLATADTSGYSGGMKPYRAIAEYYDPENERHRILQEDVPFFLGQLPKKRQSILELAVGTARAAIPLAQAGHSVVGVDYAPDMLEIARRKRDGVGLRDRDLRLVEADVTLPEFDLRERFDWVCVFFNTFLAFTTLRQQDAVLQAVRRHLKPRGRFWIDVFNPDLTLLARGSATDLEPGVFYVPRFDRTVMKTTDVRRGEGLQVQRVTFNYAWYEAGGTRRRRARREFDLTYIFPRELQILLGRNGLPVERLYGNYDGSAVRPDSPRLIARCRRG